MTLTALPLDSLIPALAVVHDHGLEGLLARVGVTGPLTDVRLLKHHAGSRCTWAVTAAGRPLIVKAYQPAAEESKAAPSVLFDVLEMLDRMGLATGHAPTVPPLVAVDREQIFYVMEEIRAPRLRDVLKSGDGVRAGALAAEWLRVTKDIVIPFGPPLGGQAWVALIEEWAEEAARVAELAAAAHTCAALLMAAPPIAARATLRHGRFSPYHVYDLGDGPALIDWDNFGLGSLDLDAAGYLTRLARVTHAPDAAATAARRFRHDVAPLVDDGVLAWHEAALLLRGAMQLARRQNVRWLDRAADLLTRAQRLAA